jgi:hypothetical protein
MCAVILTVAIALFSSLLVTPSVIIPSLMAQGPIVQYGAKAKPDKGPRAIGLVQLPSKGKARLIPIAIMMDGKFYNADSYKAAPVPMALDFGVVYEAFHTGVSQGIFTITQPGQLGHTWIAEGSWLNAAAAAKQKAKKYSPPVIEDDKDGPPVLHRRKQASETDDAGKEKAADKDKDKAKDAEAKGSKEKEKTAGDKDQQPPAQKDQQKAGGGAPGEAAPPAATNTAASSSNVKTSSDGKKEPVSDEPIQDPNRPRLRRGAPSEANARGDVYAKFEALPSLATASATSSTGKPGESTAKDAGALAQVTTYAAISDAGGPDPRPYNYDVKPDEETKYRNQMLDLAAAQFRVHGGGAKGPAHPSKSSSVTRTGGKSAVKLAKPDFEDVILHIFDLSNSNEPVLVLSAKLHPAASGSSENIGEPKEIMLIARTNLEGELRKLFFSETDAQHLDETPRMELIDVVDADGDGRGELLFRRTFDNGSAYGIYRVSADRLWPLFEGKP